MELKELRAEEGFGLVELLISMVILQVALLAIVGAFGAGSVALGRASRVNTAAALADQQMELYRAMPYDAIGLDTAGAPTSGNYISDTTVCPSGQTPVCSNTPPRNNKVPSTATWQCTTTGVATSVADYFSESGINPCVAHRFVSGASSPDGLPYYVDTYIAWAALGANQRQVKQVAVLVRSGTLQRPLAKEVSVFDCSTGTPPNAPPC
jgi:Tfp pilus assembly protein PilV